MTAFWKNLHRLAQGQLFNGGYLTEKTAAPGAARASAEERNRPHRAGDAQRAPTHAPVAAYR